jgi:uncharacterized protein YkwD
MKNKLVLRAGKIVALLLLLFVVAVGSHGIGVETGRKMIQEAEAAKSKYEVGPPDPQEMLELVNEERRKVGVEPLVIDEDMTATASWKAQYLAKTRTFGHWLPANNRILPDYLNSVAYEGCSYVGENIQIKENGTSKDAVDWWKQSKPHYKGMIDGKYTKTGFGVALNVDIPLKNVSLDNNSINKDLRNAAISVQHFCIAK